MIEQPLMHKNNKNSISITITKTYKDLKVKHEYIIHLIIETQSKPHFSYWSYLGDEIESKSS
jgi:hypothetical protein